MARIEVPKAMYGGRFGEVNQEVIAEHRANAGRLVTAFAGAPILLLNHRGATSSTPYTSPLAYTRSGDAFVVIASMGGAPVDPQWFRNLVAHPDVTIEVGAETIPVTARVAVGAERVRLFRAQADEIPNFDDYQARTARELPVVVLERRRVHDAAMSDATTTLGPATPTDWAAVPPPADALVVQNLLQMYGFLTDQGRGEDLAGLFTADAEWDGNAFGFGAATGPAAIAQLVTGHFDASLPMIHLPGPAALTAVADDEIHGVCWCMATRWTGTDLIPVLYFHYEDVFRRTDDGWRFARRLLRRRFPDPS